MNSRIAEERTASCRKMGSPITSLPALLGDVRAATAFRYDAKDSAGNRMDTAKVIQGPAGGYLAVYHSGRVCHLASSTDLVTWAHRAVVDEPATQPTIAVAPDGGLVTAAEFDDGHGGRLRIRYWATLEALLEGHPARQFLAARTLSACNEGTPSIRRMVFAPDVDASTIELGFHFHRRCRVDRQARGTLTGFSHWTTSTDPELDTAVERAAAAVSGSAATSATATTCAIWARTTTSLRLRAARATSGAGECTCMNGRPGPRSGWTSSPMAAARRSPTPPPPACTTPPAAAGSWRLCSCPSRAPRRARPARFFTTCRPTSHVRQPEYG